MFDSAINQLRYAGSILRGRRIRPEVMTKMARDLVVTLDEFGAPGQDSQLLPGQANAVDPGTQRAMATRSLRATARRAGTETAYYARLFAETGIDPDRLTLDTWLELPVTPKTALRGMPAAFVTRGSNPAVLAVTTGTTGTPTGVWFSRAEFDVLQALSTIGTALGEGIRRHHVLAFAGCSRATLPLMFTVESVTRVGASFIQLGMIEPDIAIQRLAAPVDLPGKAAQITHLTCASSYLAALVAAVEDGGWRADDFGLESISVAGEVLSAGLRQRAEEAFGASVTSPYLMTEMVPIGATHCRDGHLHFTVDFGHVELVDPLTFQPARPGQISVVLITPYVPYRDCTLLLRYATGDLVRAPAGPATCELAHLPMSSEILGRFTGAASISVTTRDILDMLDADRDVGLPARYALTDGVNGLHLHVRVRRPSDALLGRLEDRATALGLQIAAIVLHEADDLPGPTPLRADLREHTFESNTTLPVSSATTTSTLVGVGS